MRRRDGRRKSQACAPLPRRNPSRLACGWGAIAWGTLSSPPFRRQRAAAQRAAALALSSLSGKRRRSGVLEVLQELVDLVGAPKRVLERRRPVLRQAARQEIGAVEDEHVRAGQLLGLLLRELVRVDARVDRLVRRDDRA